MSDNPNEMHNARIIADFMRGGEKPAAISQAEVERDIALAELAAIRDLLDPQRQWLTAHQAAVKTAAALGCIATAPTGRLYHHPDSGDPNDWIVTPDEDCHAAAATYERVHIVPASKGGQHE